VCDRTRYVPPRRPQLTPTLPAGIIGRTRSPRFVGSGRHSNEAGFNCVMNQGGFETTTVAHVRDIFDVHPDRPFLTTVFGFASLDICIMDEVRPPHPTKERSTVRPALTDRAGAGRLSSHPGRR